MQMEIGAFILGLIIGSVGTSLINIFVINKEAKESKKTPLDILASKSAMRVFTAFVIIIAYLLSLSKELSDATYQVPVALYGLMASIVAFLFVIKPSKE